VTEEPLILQTDGAQPYRMPYGDDVRCLVGGPATGERYSLHHRTATPGSASFAHLHKRVIEAFYVIDGEFIFEIGDQKFTSGPGAYVHVPAGVRHAWRVVGDSTAHAILLFSPSVDDTFFADVDAEMKSPGGPSRERLYEINARYGLD
jgi:quercetin dioxygenase-like cupin family protein